jgi:hypothetical protein
MAASLLAPDTQRVVATAIRSLSSLPHNFSVFGTNPAMTGDVVRHASHVEVIYPRVNLRRNVTNSGRDELFVAFMQRLYCAIKNSSCQRTSSSSNLKRKMAAVLHVDKLYNLIRSGAAFGKDVPVLVFYESASTGMYECMGFYGAGNVAHYSFAHATSLSLTVRLLEVSEANAASSIAAHMDETAAVERVREFKALVDRMFGILVSHLSKKEEKVRY